MAQNIFKSKGTIENYKDDRGSSVLINHPVRAIVKDNIDATKNGRLRVYVAGFGGIDPDDDRNWVSVKYVSPWFGIASADYGINNKAVADYGNFISNPQSYGFWATAPDIGTEVICIFINGKPDDGYYIGSIPIAGMHHMVPSIAATENIVANNETESKMYAGADRLPVSELNYGNPTLQKSPKIFAEPKPIHSYQASILSNQGLIRDNIRGVIGSSSQRESPSRVFGISTPGNSVYQGGFNNKTINSAIESSDNDKLKQINRTGGHSIVLDDGTVDGKDQLMRFRTSAGHMIMMSDSGQTLFIIHSNGQSWIELGKEGTIDMYASNSVNIRTMGDLNLHADRDININAKRNLNIYSENAKFETKENYTVRTGKNFNSYHMGQYTVKVDKEMSMESTADSSYHSKATTFINGSMIHLNTGATSVTPEVVTEIEKIVHVETIYNPNVGWVNSAGNANDEPLSSVSNRVPTHQPWVGSNLGVDIKINQAKPAASSPPSETSSAANNLSDNAPSVPVTNSAVVTVPETGDVKLPNGSTALSSNTVSAMVSQQSAINNSLSQAEKNAVGVIPGVAGVTVNQLVQGGQVLKPGTEKFITDKMNLGLNVTQAISSNLTTGAFGVNTGSDLIKNTTAQINSVTSSIKNATAELIKSGDLRGNESATQSAGLISAAAVYGSSVVSNVVKSIGGIASSVATSISSVGSTLTQNIKNTISGGKFAADLVDKNASGLGGLATSISGALSNVTNSLKNTVTGIAGSISGSIKSAADVIEKSFGKLAVGVPVSLSGAQPSTENPSETQQALKQYDDAVLEEQIALDELFDAKKKYRDNPSSASLAKVQEAETKLSSARNKIASSSVNTLSKLTGSDLNSKLGTANLSSTASSITNTISSGLNSLPGGLGAIANKVSNAGTNIVSGLKNLVNNTIGNVTNNLDSFVKTSSGGILDGIKTKFNEAVNVVKKTETTLANASSFDISKTTSGMLSQLKSALSSIGGNGSVKPATLSSETIDLSAQKAKLGQLLNDVRIPIPDFDNIDFKASFQDYRNKQVSIQSSIVELEQSLKEENLKLTKLQEDFNPFESDFNSISAIENQSKVVEDKAKQLKEKQEEYARLIGYNDPGSYA